MKILRQIGKYLLALAVGVAGGLVLGGGCALLFSDMSLSQFFAKLASFPIFHLLKIVGEGLVGLVVASVIGITLHEAGHLVFGLLTGYRFVSFRVFSLTLIQSDGRLRWKRFALDGTGGQCLMRPPARPVADIDTRWYNAGGVLMNLLLVVVCLALFCWSSAPEGRSRLPEWLELFLLMSVIVNGAYALLNGIPMRMAGVGNDGYNLLHLERSPVDKRLLYLMLEANARVQEGTRPGDLPAEWFDTTPDQAPIDWADGLQANWQAMVVSHLEDRHEWEAAYALLADAMAHRQQLIGLFEKELVSEAVFVCLATGRQDEARAYWTDDIAAYVRQYAKMQTSKQRTRFAVSLLIDADPDAAQALLDDLRAHRDRYLLQGEAAMDLGLMEWLAQSHG